MGYYVEIRVVNEISSHSESSGLPPFALVGQVKPTELARFLKGKDKDKVGHPSLGRIKRLNAAWIGPEFLSLRTEKSNEGHAQIRVLHG